MTEPLYYRILKCLKENDNGDYVDLSFIDENKKLLDSKLKELIEKKFIKRTATPYATESYISSKNPVYKILIDGTTYLKKIESEKRTSKIEDLTLKKLQFEQIPAKFWWLIIIGMAFISILTTWVNNQIEKSENPKMQQQQKIPEQK
jgi:uncharacterized membrane protein YraQ (UPF0718 family)